MIGSKHPILGRWGDQLDRNDSSLKPLLRDENEGWKHQLNAARYILLGADKMTVQPEMPCHTQDWYKRGSMFISYAPVLTLKLVYLNQTFPSKKNQFFALEAWSLTIQCPLNFNTLQYKRTLGLSGRVVAAVTSWWGSLLKYCLVESSVAWLACKVTPEFEV